MDLGGIACLLQFRSPDGLWHARATPSTDWGHGETAEEAVRAALKPAVTPRRRVVASEPAPRRRPVQGGFFE